MSGAIEVGIDVEFQHLVSNEEASRSEGGNWQRKGQEGFVHLISYISLVLSWLNRFTISEDGNKIS